MTRIVAMLLAVATLLLGAPSAKADATYDSMDGHLSLGAWVEQEGSQLHVVLLGAFQGHIIEDSSDPTELLGLTEPPTSFAGRAVVDCDLETETCEITDEVFGEIPNEAYTFDPLFGWARLDATVEGHDFEAVWLGRGAPEPLYGTVAGLDPAAPAVEVGGSAGMYRMASVHASGPGVPADPTEIAAMVDAVITSVLVDGSSELAELVT